MSKGKRLVACAAVSALFAAEALATPVLGKRMKLANPTGAEADRTFSLIADEQSTDVPPIAGDPASAGASLRIILDEGSAAQTFDLEASGWTAIPRGYRYSRPPGPAAEPVERVLLKRTPRGRASLKVVLDGDLGTRDLTLVPPDPGTALTAVLELGSSGERYCASFGGPAGGTVLANDLELWSIRTPTAEPECPPEEPPLCCRLGAECGWDREGSCELNQGTLGAPGTVCNAATGTCDPPPATPGQCCDILFSGPSFCVAGPSFDPNTCADVGGFTPNAHCTPAGCVPG